MAVLALAVGLINLLTGFFGGVDITAACFLVTALALRGAFFLWRRRSTASPPPQRVMRLVTRWLALGAALVILAVVVIDYLAHRDVVAALLFGLILAFSFGSGILLARKMAEPPRA